MSLAFWIDAPAKIVRLEYRGQVEVDDFTAALEAVFRDPAYRPGFGFLVDRRAANPPTVDYTERVLAFALLHERELRGARWALVVASAAAVDMGHFGEKLAASAALPQAAQVFRDPESAEAWLRVTALGPRGYP